MAQRIDFSYGQEQGAHATPKPLPKRNVGRFDCHPEAKKTCNARFQRPAKKSSKSRRAKRDRDSSGCLLPTRRELEFVLVISGYIRYEPPSGYERELWFVRAFLDVFAYGPRSDQTPKREVKRRCNVARDIVSRGYSYLDFERKLGLTRPCAEVLYDYAIQRLRATRWKQPPDQEGNQDSPSGDDEFKPCREGQQLQRPEWYEEPDEEECDYFRWAMDQAMEKFAHSSEELLDDEDVELAALP